MSIQQYRKPPNVSIQSILNDFLNHINYNNVHQLPCNNNPRVLAARARIGRRIQRFTGIDLMKRNVKREAQRLQLHNQYLLNLATNRIWRLNSTRYQRMQFINLASDANNINQNMTRNNIPIDRISQINIPQVASNPFEDNLFNGTYFNNINSNNLDSLILPAGSLNNLGTSYNW